MGKKTFRIDFKRPSFLPNGMKPWDYERWDLMGKPGEKLTELVRHELNVELVDGHVLSKREVDGLRKLLIPQGKSLSRNWCLRHTDQFFILVAKQLKSARKLPMKKRIKNLEKEICNPAKSLLDALNFESMLIEMSHPRTAFIHDEIAVLRASLIKFMTSCDRHLAMLSSLSKKGKPWNSDIKDSFVRLTDMLCSSFDGNFASKRKSQYGKEENSKFRDACTLLGAKVFHEESLDWAIRKYVDAQNQARSTKN